MGLRPGFDGDKIKFYYYKVRLVFPQLFFPHDTDSQLFFIQEKDTVVFPTAIVTNLKHTLFQQQ